MRLWSASGIGNISNTSGLRTTKMRAAFVGREKATLFFALLEKLVAEGARRRVAVAYMVGDEDVGVLFEGCDNAFIILDQ